MLGSLSYQSVLRRGFALVRDERGAAVRSIERIAPGMRLEVELADGRVPVEAQRPESKPPARPAEKSAPSARASEAQDRAPRASRRGSAQRSLFDD